MKHIFLIALIFGFGILTRAQTEYEVSGKGTDKILKGIISRDLLISDTSFSWWQPSQAGYTPNASAVAALKAKGSELQFVVFGGTWSGDTRAILPKFFAILDAASFPADQITLVGVDQDKKDIDHLTEEMHITKLPTFILLKDGKEWGRVEQSGRTGHWDQEIGELVASAD
ncbi:MAG: thioredoxin family protein [Puia sp.]|nr:thioredoxin family protein [Puia sp.]